MLPKIPTSRLKGIIPKLATPVSLEEIDAVSRREPRSVQARKIIGLDTSVLVRYLREGVGFMIEIELQRIHDFPHFFVHKVVLELAKEIGIGEARRRTRPRGAVVIPPFPLCLGSRDIEIRIHHLPWSW